MRAARLPNVSLVTSLGPIARAEKPARLPSPAAVAKVVHYLSSARSSSRENLHGALALTPHEIDRC